MAGKRGLLSPLGGGPGVGALAGGAGERDTGRAAGHRQLLRVLLDGAEQPGPQRRVPVVRRSVNIFVRANQMRDVLKIFEYFF